MTREEFVRLSTSTGYASKKVAEEYAKDKDKFTSDDFEEVFRLHQVASRTVTPGNARYREICGVKTTKRYDQEFKD